uniref:Uncharacterized protein n=1 Tax=Aureoumbra lagunensis TaxID=44058 RepID=A0A7S3K5K9_9STRA|mmetsp:Transcript_18159/g.27410  ORF Transcript_18159/g.27410 Transcript_18159/m.27410 type:complete len:187 (+) Transcript_18159:84-644(+)
MAHSQQKEHGDVLSHVGAVVVERSIHLAAETSMVPLFAEATGYHKIESYGLGLGLLLVAFMAFQSWRRMKSEFSKQRFGKSTLLFGGATCCDLIDAIVHILVLNILPIAHNISAHSVEKLGHGAALFSIALVVLAEIKSVSNGEESNNSKRRGRLASSVSSTSRRKGGSSGSNYRRKRDHQKQKRS